MLYLSVSYLQALHDVFFAEHLEECFSCVVANVQFVNPSPPHPSPEPLSSCASSPPHSPLLSEGLWSLRSVDRRELNLHAVCRRLRASLPDPRACLPELPSSIHPSIARHHGPHQRLPIGGSRHRRR